MPNQLQVTVLIENTAQGVGLRGEHGLAYWLDAPGKRVLLDTGQSPEFLRNAELLDIPIEDTDALVLSHGHFDHTGGLEALLDRAAPFAMYAHPGAFQERYSHKPGQEPLEIGVPGLSEEDIGSRGVEIVWTREPTEVADRVFVTGEVPRITDFEDTGGAFYLDAAGTAPDPIRDDQSLFFDTREGLVVLLGCAHAGVVNTLRHIAKLTDGRPIHMVAGGMHLVRASEKRMSRTIEAFKELDVQYLCPMHCTGWPAVPMLREAFPDRFVRGLTGSIFTFDPR